MKKILLTAATASEIRPLLDYFRVADCAEGEVQQIPRENFLLLIAVTGVGMVNTSYFLTRIIITFRPEIVVNAGIAGSFSEALQIGQIVRVSEDYFADLGAEDDDHFLSIDDLGMGISLIRDEKSLFLKPAVLKQYPFVRAITVNRVHGKEESIHSVQSRLNPEIETMEGAAFTMICMREKVLQLHLRCISNKVERRNRANWNIPLAIERLNDCLIQLLPTLA